MTPVLARSDLVCWEHAGTRVTLAPTVGRVLQVEVDGHRAFWNDRDAGGWNVGGDRLWLGPEAGWFWTTPTSYDHRDHLVQEALDPGSWRVVSNAADHLAVFNDATLRHLPTGSVTTVHVTQHVSSLQVILPLFNRAVAYRVDSGVRRLGGLTADGLCLWRSLQVPPGGEIHARCVGSPTYRDYFDPAPDDHCRRTGDSMIFRITGQRRFKVGISPDVTTGRTAYVRPAGAERLVIVQQFSPEPSRDYSDAPREHEGGRGDAVQVYNDGGQFGGFGEMEHHSPALGAQETEVSDSTVTVVGTVAEASWDAWRELWLDSPFWPLDAARSPA